jgi:dihydropteroate synthase
MTINCNGKLIDLSSPKVMGILNFTPDSFFDGGKYKTLKSNIFYSDYFLCFSSINFERHLSTCI